jgi:hypothetical protein
MDKLKELEALIDRLQTKGAHTISVKNGDTELVVQFAPRMPQQQQTDLTGFTVPLEGTTNPQEEDEDLIYAASL